MLLTAENIDVQADELCQFNLTNVKPSRLLTRPILELPFILRGISEKERKEETKKDEA